MSARRRWRPAHQRGNPRSATANGKNGWKWIRCERRFAIYPRDGLKCVFCLQSHSPDGYGLTLDHWIPRFLDGGNENSNLVTACLSCNSRRASHSDTDFIRTMRAAGHVHACRGLFGRVRFALRKPVNLEDGKAFAVARYGHLPGRKTAASDCSRAA